MNDLTLNINFHDTKEGSQSSLYALCPDVDGIGFYSGGGDGVVVHWPEATEENGFLVAKTGGQIMTMTVDVPSNRLLIGTLDGYLIIIDLSEYTLIKSVKLMTGGIFAIKKTEFGYFISGDNGALSQVDPDNFKIQRSIQISNSRTRALTMHGDYFYAGTSEGRIYKIDALRMKETHVSEIHHNSSVFSIVHCEGQLFSAGKDGRILKWNESLIKTDEVQAHNTTINTLIKIGESGLLASGCRDGSIRIWNSNDLELLKVIDLYLHSGHLRSVNQLIWSDFDKLMISCSDDKKIKTWSIN